MGNEILKSYVLFIDLPGGCFLVLVFFTGVAELTYLVVRLTEMLLQLNPKTDLMND